MKFPFLKKRYVYNRHTMLYEVHKIPLKRYLQGGVAMFLGSIVLFFIYMCIYRYCFGLTLPKTEKLQLRSLDLKSKLEILDVEMDSRLESLQELQLRDNNVYRPIFGLEEISAQERNSGISSEGRYDSLTIFRDGDYMRHIERSMDVLLKKAYMQSVSYDEVFSFATRAGDMAKCVPAIPPMKMNKVKFSSRFGYRHDPIFNSTRYHSGIDLSGRRGEHVYATGDGRVSEVVRQFYGYGLELVIDHGFGYKTRYAHLNRCYVEVGDYVTRGEYIADMGNSGRSTGPHLHYEVIYRGNKVNPLNYFDSEMKSAEYANVIADTLVKRNRSNGKTKNNGR